MRNYSEWKPIPGYDGKYEASYFGQVRRIYKNAKPKLLTAYEKKNRKGSRYLVVKLTNDSGSKEIKLATTIYLTFRGNVPDGGCITHKDGDFANNECNNLIILTKEELGRRTGYMSKHKPVLKCTPDLVPIDCYRSAREAARCNYMSYQTVIDRCNGKCKSLCAPDGYVYMWDDESFYEEAA
ncbi:NUMOD4 domain-containing protein [Butyrivibrio proteoclasticus]|uniref:NUMOD4 domain-containing protein n=1 Tax=Butyrivibrio proteoclasticus TaxID=43305 RepID=UPI000550ED62|nr:NUMOD4 domain-containing protein [Butyrivibrio proteoclasticus]